MGPVQCLPNAACSGIFCQQTGQTQNVSESLFLGIGSIVLRWGVRRRVGKPCSYSEPTGGFSEKNEQHGGEPGGSTKQHAEETNDLPRFFGNRNSTVAGHASLDVGPPSWREPKGTGLSKKRKYHGFGPELGVD